MDEPYGIWGRWRDPAMSAMGQVNWLYYGGMPAYGPRSVMLATLREIVASPRDLRYEPLGVYRFGPTGLPVVDDAGKLEAVLAELLDASDA